MKTIIAILIYSAAAYAADKPAPPKATTPTVATTPAGSKVVSYAAHDIVPIAGKIRFTTMIQLPATEQILDFICGDKEFWKVDGQQNFAFVKPAKAGSETNLNLITASGNVYSFVLREVGDGTPDLKVFIEPRDEGFKAAAAAPPKFVPASAVEDWREQAKLARDAADKAGQDAAAKIKEAEKAAAAERDAALAKYPTTIDSRYRFDPKDSIFRVESIYHDARFTYIRASPTEVPTVYEVKDKKPSLVNFQYRDGLYVIDKIVSSGYLAIGNRKLYFAQD